MNEREKMNLTMEIDVTNQADCKTGGTQTRQYQDSNWHSAGRMRSRNYLWITTKEN